MCVNKSACDDQILDRIVKHILKEREEVECVEMINMLKILSDYKNVYSE